MQPPHWFYYHIIIIMSLAAARALMSVDDMSAEDVARKSMDIASNMCVYTNKQFLKYTLDDMSGSNSDEWETSLN